MSEITIELPGHVILELALIAHKRDITLNALFIKIIKEKIDELSSITNSESE